MTNGTFTGTEEREPTENTLWVCFLTASLVMWHYLAGQSNPLHNGWTANSRGWVRVKPGPSQTMDDSYTDLNPFPVRHSTNTAQDPGQHQAHAVQPTCVCGDWKTDQNMLLYILLCIIVACSSCTSAERHSLCGFHKDKETCGAKPSAPLLLPLPGQGCPISALCLRFALKSPMRT